MSGQSAPADKLLFEQSVLGQLEVFEEYLPRAEYSRDMRLTQKSGDEPNISSMEAPIA